MSTRIKFAKVLAVTALAAVANLASASALLLDRGLPTANLNNAAGSDRSNVSWTEGAPAPSNNYWLVGDTITNTTGQDWNVTTLRMWTTGSTSTARLWGGVEGFGMGVLAGSGSIGAATTYATNDQYQTSSGSFIDLFQIDFSVNITLAAGQTLDFFFDGTGGPSGYVPFLHASNGALSGSTQEGSDDWLLEANVDDSTSSVISSNKWRSNGTDNVTDPYTVWDKASDVNVQVFGNAIPEPASLALVAFALVGAGLSGRRRTR